MMCLTVANPWPWLMFADPDDLKDMPDYVRCQCCRGTGRQKLTGVYSETLRIVRRLTAAPGSYVVATRHAEKFGCQPTALNNRLIALERHGLVTSERYGRQRRFRAK